MENGNNGKKKKKKLKWFINIYPPQGIGLKMPFYYFIIC